MSTVVVSCPFFLVSSATTLACARQVLYDTSFGSQHHYRSSSSVDDETTAHNEWVRLNREGEKGAVSSVALADGASRSGNVHQTNLCWAGLRHQRFELMWTPRGRAECFLESRSMEKCAQSTLLLLNLPALFAPGNLDTISTNTS